MGPSTIIIIILIIIIIVVLLTLIASISKGSGTAQYKYTKRGSFFTKNELSFYRELLSATKGMNVIVFSKVRLADLLEPQKGSSNWQASFNKICSKHTDFVLCELPQVRPVLAIELDDSSHDTQKRKERDQFVDQAFSSAKLPILHVRGSGNIKEKIRESLSLQTVRAPTAKQ